MFPTGAPYSEVALQRYATLLDVADVVCSRQRPAELFRDLFPRLRSAVPCDLLYYAVYDSSRETIHMYLWNGGEPWPDVAEEITVEESAAGWVWRNQQSLTLDDVEGEERFKPCLRSLRLRGMRSYCVLPLTTSRQKMGALGIASAQVKAFAAPEEQFLSRVAEMVALSIDNTQAQSALLEEKERIRLLLDLSNFQAGLADQRTPELEERISQLLEPLQKWAGSGYVGLYLYHKDSGSLNIYTRDPQLGPYLVNGSTAPLEGTVAGRVFRKGKPEILNYADLSQSSFASVKRGLALGVKSLCMVPVLRGQEPVGVLKVASQVDEAFSARDVELLTQVAAIAAVSVMETPLASRASQKVEQSQSMLKVSNGLSCGKTDRAKGAASVHREGAKLIPFVSAPSSVNLEHLLAAYFNSSTVGLCILDTEFRYLAINRVLAEKNGLSAEAYLGKSVVEVLGDLGPKIRPELERVLATGEPVLDFEVRAIPSGGAALSRWLKHYFPIQDTEGRVRQIGVIVVEITEPRKLDESLRQLTDKLQQEQSRVQTLRELDVALSRNFDLRQLFVAATKCLDKVMPYDLAGIWLYEQHDQIMRTAALDSRVGEVFREGDVAPLGECMLGQSMLTGESLACNLAEVSALAFPTAKRLLEYGIQSVCCVPLITPKGPLGSMGLGSRRDRAFSREDAALLSHTASSIALALEISLTREDLQREKDRLQVLSEVSSALSRAKIDFHQTFPVISSSIRKVVRSDAVAIYVLDRGAGRARIYSVDHVLTELGPNQDKIVPLYESILSQLMEEHEARNFTRQELEVYSRRLERLWLALDEGLQCLCYVPLMTPRGMLGALLLSRKDSRRFTDQDIDFLKRLASEVALAVESSTALEALGREKQRLQALHDIDAALIADPDLDSLLPVVSECLRKTLPHDRISLHLYEESIDALRDHAPSTETKRKIVPDGIVPLRGSIAGQVFVDRKTRIVNYPELSCVPYPIARRAIEQGVRSICFVPLITNEGALGVLVLSSKGDEAFQKSDVEFLGQVAAALAQAVQNAQAHKALLEERKRLQVLLNVSAALAANRNVQESFPIISSHLRRVLRHECAFFSLYDEKNNLFVRQAQDFPLGRGLMAATSAVVSGGPQSLALAEQRPVIFSRDAVQAFRSNPDLAELANSFLGEGLKSMCCIPLLCPKGPLGTLTLASTRAEAFGAADAALLHQIASQLSIALENTRIAGEIEELNSRLADEKLYLEGGERRAGVAVEGIIGESDTLLQALSQVATVAGSDATALILGETGTGKELIARAIHRMSKRRDRGFIKLNCAAIPTGLLESELFGHEKGAFTGAIAQKIGRLELADQGTLFMDEVGEIPLELQPKLLRVLQDHEFERLGGTRTIKVNLRLVAATNRDLGKRVSSGDFRSDLFYRLNVFPIRMPPLRERRDDIPALVRHFVQKYAREMDRQIESVPTEAMKALIQYHWPGNVRELENLIERSVILSEGPGLRVPLSELMAERPIDSPSDTLENAEREHIVRVLRETGGVISGPEGAAHKLGLKRTTLQSKMQRLRIAREDYGKGKFNS